MVHKGSGYASTLPAKVTVDPPPPRVSSVSYLYIHRSALVVVGDGDAGFSLRDWIANGTEI